MWRDLHTEQLATLREEMSFQAQVTSQCVLHFRCRRKSDKMELREATLNQFSEQQTYSVSEQWDSRLLHDIEVTFISRSMTPQWKRLYMAVRRRARLKDKPPVSLTLLHTRTPVYNLVPNFTFMFLDYGRKPQKNPHRHREKMQTSHRKAVFLKLNTF